MSVVGTAFGPSMAWSFLFPWLFAIGGFGLPVGVPPLPEDPMIAKIAPEECLGYMALAGMATPDPKSPNQTEQLLAEPEVQQMAKEIERVVRSAFGRSAGRSPLPGGLSNDNAIDAAKLLLTRPLAIYVSRVQVQPSGPVVCGGAIINLGDNVAKIKAEIEAIVASLPPPLLQPIDIDGKTWQSLKAGPNLSVAWGFQDNYLLVALGDGEIQALVKRTHGQPPAWLTQLRQQLPVERLSTVTYANLKAIADVAMPLAGPKADSILKALGLRGMTAIRSVTGLDGEGFVSRTLLTIEGQPEGVLRLTGAKPLTPADLVPIPQDAAIAVAFRLSLGSAFDLVQEIARKIDPAEAERMNRDIGRIEEGLGLKLRDDILEPLGDAWCVFGAPDEGGLSGLMAVLPLKDPQRAAATHAKLVKLLQPYLAKPQETSDRNFFNMPSRLEESDFAGKKIYVYQGQATMFVFAPAWCMTEKELVVAMNPQAIKAYLSRGPEFKSLAQAPVAAELFRGDPGPLKLIYSDSKQLFDAIYPAALSYLRLVPMFAPGFDLNASILPSVRAIRPHLGSSLTAVRRTPAGIEITERRVLPGVSVATAVPLGLVGLVSATSAANESAHRTTSINNMKEIALGMHNYHDAKGRFPPAYTVDKEGKPLLSWRVLILPYTEDNMLYEQFRLDEPWDSEHNKKLIARMPQFYKSPESKVSSDGKTNYLTVRGEKSVFPGKTGISMRDVPDGTAYTIMTVEVSDEKAVIWTKPNDFEYDEKDPMKGLVGLRPGRFLAGFTDGSVRSLPASIDATMLNALFTRNGGETIDRSILEQ